MDVLIVYDGKRGHIREAGEALARAAEVAGVGARATDIDMAGPTDIASADVLVVGCWVKGDTPFGGDRMGRVAGWVEKLPAIDGKPAGAFCTYGFFPMFFADAVAHTGEALDRLRAALEDKGANVVATHAIHRRSPESGAAEFIDTVLKGAAV